MTGLLSRLAAIGLFLACLGAIWAFVLAPLSDWRSAMLGGAEAARREHARLTEAGARLDAEEAALATGGVDGLFWVGDQTGAIYARIQSDLSRAASQNGISFRAITPLPIQTRGELNAAVVRLEFESDLEKVTAFLRDIEYASPALPIQRAAIRRLLRPNETSRQPVLFVQLDIAAPVLVGSGG